jgi:16S rRNA (uracil1498-N3)-methyltransferase
MGYEFGMADEVMEPGGRTRLYVTADLGEGVALPLSDGHVHYLLHVLRAKAGDHVRLFNGRHGEWSAELETVTKRGIIVRMKAQTAPQVPAPDVWLVFAPVKKTPGEYLVQKATELGASRLQPVFTRRTIAARINEERLLANAVEAAEQSERVSVPDIAAPLKLEKLIDGWPKDRLLYFCDEAGATATACDAKPLAKAARPGPAAILTGPEGGFDPAERELLRSKAFVVPVTLGPRILRADTAALAALAVWQSVAGDWPQA